MFSILICDRCYMQGQKIVVDVVIIGAGPAAIGAANLLHANHVDFVVLEARNRIGGRVYSELIDGISVDLGACWIHNYAPNNPMHPYIQQFNIPELKLDRSRMAVLLDEKGGEFDRQTIKQAYQMVEELHEKMEEKASELSEDISLYEASKEYLDEVLQGASEQLKKCVNIFMGKTESYEATSIKKLSAKHYQSVSDEQEVEYNFIPICRYSGVFKKIADSFSQNIKLNHVVQSVSMTESGVTVQCENSSVFEAKKLISSLPLGVLKQNKIIFTPELPKEYLDSINKLGFGLMNKIIVEFEQSFWHDDTEWILVDTEEKGKFSNVFNSSKDGHHLLYSLIIDDFAKKMEALTDQQVLKQFVGALQKIYPSANIKVKEYKITRWGQEKYSLGSYSTFAVGSSPKDCLQLRTPINNTMWFVGQHCAAENIGMAHGAFNTGVLAAQQVLDLLKSKQ